MGKAMELVSGSVTNPSTTFTAWTMAAGDSNVVRNFNDPNQAHWEEAWCQGATAGILRVKSPRMHDNLQNVRAGYLAATPQPVLPEQMSQRLFPQDNITIEQTGGGSEVDAGSLLFYYDDLPGAAARLGSWEAVRPLIKNWVTMETTHTIGSSAGTYSGSVAINSTFNILKANEDYALIGYLVSAAVCSIGWKSPDFGNLRVGGPGTTQRIETRSWFRDLDRKLAGPCIPVFNAANAGSTFVDLLSTATSGTVVVQSILAELGTNSGIA